ncbi:hypothetical protein [Streptomyces ureilyticus]|uniref:Pertussis toxin subunit 1 n=1 Tax=Streptomyces ureilyticus TaxID=1775131 RepID=A0ABX0E7K5_9ACTN|nr:hypothetical protein [Streptomyces ureilyticus]NGO47431.1 hypothetical protein [Streptomyces ureilyticus]
MTLVATGALVATTGSASAQNEPSGSVSQGQPPGVVYRGDSRSPNDIFANGFTARGTNYDLRSHVHGGAGSYDSGYISTSGSRDVAVPFARSQGQINLANQAGEPRCQGPGWTIGESIPVVGWLIMSHCIHSTVEARTFVYTINPQFANVLLYVPDQLRGDPAMYDHYRSQDEWAFFHRIPPQAITGVQIYRMTGRAVNGRLEPQSITFNEEQWVPNPNYVSNYRYNPEADPTANLSPDQDLNIPAIPANDYNRGCNAAQQCRDGQG